MSAVSEPASLRKSKLVLRAHQERIELASQIEDFRQATQLPALIKGLLPTFAAKKGLPLALDVLRRYPFIGAAVSFVLARIKHALSGSKASKVKASPKLAAAATVAKVGGALKLGSLLLAAWRAWRAVRKLKSAKRRLR